MKLPLRIAAFIVVVLTVFAIPGERSGRADDFSAKIYDDVKDIVEDLIRKEATKGLVRFMLRVDGAKVEGKTIDELKALAAPPPREDVDVIAFYFHDAIERIYRGQLGSVGREFRNGLVDLLTDVVFEAIQAADPDVFMATTAADKPRVVRDKTFDLKDAATRVATLLGASAQGFGWKLYLHLESSGQPLPDTSTIVENICHAPEPPTSRSVRVACAFAQGVRSELKDGPKEMEFYLQELMAAVFPLGIRADNQKAFEGLFRRWFGSPEAFEQDFGHLTGGAAVEKLAKFAGSCDDVSYALDDFAAGKELCWAWELGERVAPRLKVSVVGSRADPRSVTQFLAALGGRTTSIKEKDLRGAVRALFCIEPPVHVDAGTNSAVPTCPDGRADLTLSINGKLFPVRLPATNGDPAQLNPELVRWLSVFDQLAKDGDLLRRSYGRIGNLPGELSLLDDPISRMKLLIRANQLMAFLKRAHGLITQTGGSDHATAQSLSALALQGLREACGEDDVGICSLTKTLSALVSDYRFRDVVRYGARADYRALATHVLEAVLPAPNPLEGTLCSDGEKCRRFFIAFAAYGVEVANGGSDDRAARAAFKSAAEDLLAESPDDKRLFPARGRASYWPTTFAVPSGSLRLSWSPDYYNGVGGDQFRYLVSIDWLTLFRWAPFHNVGLQMTLVDLAAPFGELAYRPRAHVVNSEAVAIDVLRPRLDVLVAVPEFSRRLMLTAGFSWRPYSIDFQPAPSATDQPTLVYHAFTECLGRSDQSCVGYRFSGEFSLGVKMLF